MNKQLLPFLFILFFINFTALAIEQHKKEEVSVMRKESPFGVLEFLHWNHDWNGYKYSTNEELEKIAKLMKEAGVDFVRMDFLWGDIEPCEGSFDFEKYDTIVNIMAENKINILGILDYTAPWAAEDCDWNSPPMENKLFVAFAIRVINRYKDKIKYWEVWNEPDSGVYWKKQDALKSYVVLLKEVYKAAKIVDPECFILNGGLAGGLLSVNRLYEQGAKDYFDIMNIHSFETPMHQNAIKAVEAFPRLVYKTMKRNGDAYKKIWITEIGCPGVKRGLKVKDWWMGRNPNEKQQADWVKQVYVGLLKDKNVEKIFWAFFRDTNKHWDDGVDYFGLVRWDFSKKPSFTKYQEIYESWKRSKKQ